jgi:hypothetical protein
VSANKRRKTVTKLLHFRRPPLHPPAHSPKPKMGADRKPFSIRATDKKGAGIGRSLNGAAQNSPIVSLSFSFLSFFIISPWLLQCGTLIAFKDLNVNDAH